MHLDSEVTCHHQGPTNLPSSPKKPNMGISTTSGTYLLEKLHVLNSAQKVTPWHAIYTTKAFSFILILLLCSNSLAHTTTSQHQISITIGLPGVHHNWPFWWLALPASIAENVYGISSHLGDTGPSNMCVSTNYQVSNFSATAIMARKSLLYPALKSNWYST